MAEHRAALSRLQNTVDQIKRTVDVLKDVTAEQTEPRLFGRRVLST